MSAVGIRFRPIIISFTKNDLPYTTTFKTSLFADDIVLLLSNKKQVISNLQKLLTWLYVCTKINYVSIKKKQNKYIFNPPLKNRTNQEKTFTLKSVLEEIEQVESHTYLEIKFDKFHANPTQNH